MAKLYKSVRKTLRDESIKPAGIRDMRHQSRLFEG